MKIDPASIRIEVKEGETPRIHIETGPYSGVVYSYVSASFPDENEPILKFEYTIHESPVEIVASEFEHAIGDILVELIRSQLESGEIVYHGGT